MIIFLGPRILASHPLSLSLASALRYNAVLVCRGCGEWGRVVVREGAPFEGRGGNCPSHPDGAWGVGSLLHPWRNYPCAPELWAWATYSPKLLRHEFSVLMAEAGFALSRPPCESTGAGAGL